MFFDKARQFQTFKPGRKIVNNFWSEVPFMIKVKQKGGEGNSNDR